MKWKGNKRRKQNGNKGKKKTQGDRSEETKGKNERERKILFPFTLREITGRLQWGGMSWRGERRQRKNAGWEAGLGFFVRCSLFTRSQTSLFSSDSICVLGYLSLAFTFHFFKILNILIFKFNTFLKRVSKCVILVSCCVDPKMTRLIK